MVYQGKVQFRNGARVPASWDPQLVHEELRDIKARYGELTAENVTIDVEAEPDTHYLRDGFTWDSEIAMHKLHVIEAGNVIRSVVLHEIVPEQKAPIRAWVVTRDNDRPAYDVITSVLTDQDKARALLTDVEREKLSADSKFAELVELMRLLIRAA